MGFAKVNWRSTTPEGTRVGGEVEKIYCLASATGLGLGSAMLGRIIGTAGKRQQNCLWLDVLESNVGAIRLYERFGFRQVGVTQFETDLSSIPMHVMVKPLP